MNNKIKLLAIGATSLILGFSASSFVMSNTPANFKVAVVDVQKVVTSSKQVVSLKEEQKKKIEDLAKFVEKAKTDVAKETDSAKQKALEEKYNKELNVKKEAIDKEYVGKLTSIDKNITGLIEKKAKSDGYDIVLAKSVVLFGGTDITEEITKAVK